MKALPNNLSHRPFLIQEALRVGLNKYDLKQMLEQGHVDRVSRGVYQVSDVVSDQEQQYEVATLRCGAPSAVCLLSALDAYHLTDQIPQQTWMLVPHSKRIVAQDLKLVRARNPQWEIGIQKHHGYWMTSIERTLIDVLIYKRLIGTQVALAATKQALREKKVKLGKLYDMAKKMGVAHRILPYVEALAS